MSPSVSPIVSPIVNLFVSPIVSLFVSPIVSPIVNPIVSHCELPRPQPPYRPWGGLIGMIVSSYIV